ncbi:MAG: Fe-S cluster assembly protein SufD [Verrucomicrobia bacterium]|nr:Fe-S cluster assembly protein SufD [Verrucomicrobiota bacterium]
MTSTELSSILSGPGQSSAPGWFKELQAKAWEEFEAEPLPTRSNELWRFSSVKNLGLDGYVAAPEFSGDPFSWTRPREFPQPSGRIVFANDSVVTAELLDPALESAGVVFTTLADALEKHADRLREHFMAQSVRLGSAKFASLHKSLVQAGTFIWIPRGVEIHNPFEVFHLVQGDWTTVFPHTLIIAEDNSRVTLLEHFVSANPEERGLACGVNDLVLNPGSKLSYISIQEWSRNFVSVQMNSTLAKKDSAALNLALNFGGKYSRLESVSRMVESGARSDMLAISVARDEQEFDQRTLQDHQKPDTTSDLLYKNALHDQSRTIFSGLIKVEPGAHRTDAYQKVRNLLLSDDAEANSMPGLEILADDVRCTHGATSGQVEPEELFYLKSRGINDLAAKRLIARGFLNEVVDRLPQERLSEYLHQQIEARL